jgi:uncharacterized SAM-binding protein YcdF (DUF218 family)
MKERTRRRLWNGLLVLVVAVVVLRLAAPALLESYAKWLIVEDPVRPSDAIVTLSGAEGERLFDAIRLWKEKIAPRLVIVGPDTPLLKVYTREDSLSQGEIKKRIAIRKGVPEEDIILALGATSTYEEAESALREASERGWKSIVIVTSPFHTRRARATYHAVFRGSGVEVRVHHLPIPLSQSDPKRWWRRERDTMSVLTETIKLAYYAYRYHITPWT